MSQSNTIRYCTSSDECISSVLLMLPALAW